MFGSWIRLLVFVCYISLSFPWILLDENGYEYKDGDRIALSLKNDGNSSTDISHKVIHKSLLLAPFSTISFQLLDVPTYVLFVVTQVHSFKYNITLSYEPQILPGSHVNGTNIGLVKENSGMSPHNMEFFIMNSNPAPVMCLLAFEAYRHYDPVPGGCNREFSVEIAPYLLLTYNDAIVTMDMQPAAATGLNPDCDTYPFSVELEVYHIYMEERNFSSEAYFEAIKKMMSVEGMMRSGTLVPPIEVGPLRRIHAAYPGTGSVYGVVARSQNGNVAAYVPSVTYACGNKLNLYDDCDIFTIPLSEALCACMLFIGMFICICGHQKFLLGSSLVIFLWGTVITCIILGMNYGTSYGIDVLGILIGFLFAIVWFIFWLLFGIPFIAALSSTLALGFLLASSIMYAGLGSAPWLTYDFSFWCVFLSITVTVPMLFMSAMHIGNMVACATLGAYVFITPIDHYLGSNLKYIFLNTLRRAISNDFRLAEVDPPFELKDLLLILTWLTLAGCGTAVQLFLQRRQPPFPPGAATWCHTGSPSSSPATAFGQGVSATTQPRRSLLQRAAVLGSGGRGGERTPLLVDVRIAANTSDTSNDSVFESPPRAAAVPDSASAPPLSDPRHAASPVLPPKDELAASTEKLANRLLAVLEPPGPEK